jgi:hypothetical protein
MAGKQVTGPTRAVADTNADRYPKITEVFAEVVSQLEDKEAPIERVEVTALANGDATYRVYPARAEEPEMGFIPAS